MRDPNTWSELLKIEPDYMRLEAKILSGEVSDYRQIPTHAFSWHAWDLISEERLFEIILPFLRLQLARAKVAMPQIYGQILECIDPTDIRTLQDWWSIPILLKDDDPEIGLRGFRPLVAENPGVMRPSDLSMPTAIFGSGGSMGKFTPTYVTQQDRARESHGWTRGHAYHGLVSGDTALYTYNTTHKGGQWMQESLWLHGVDVIPRRPEEGPEHVLENLRDYDANVLFTVQQPYEIVEHQAKSAGINLHSLIMASLEYPEYQGILIPDERGYRQIEFIFLGGFEIVPYANELADNYLAGVPIATILGSSEAIPQACSTHPHLTPNSTCHHNNLHLLQSPHYIEILKPERDRWVPVDKGEQGLLTITSWARDGTLWIRYAPGDLATKCLNEGECQCGLRSPVITNVHRKNMQEMRELFILGCAAG
jgi:phenylacetate-CoA ligase